MQVAVLGAGGYVGSRVVAALTAAGATTQPVARGAVPSARGSGPLVSAAGGDETVRASILAALAAGRDVVDLDRAAGHVAWAHEHAGASARETGARLVPGAGLRWGIGDLLVAVAAADLDRIGEVHVAYTAGGGGGPHTPGERRARLAALGEPVRALVAGRWVEELPGAARRLAWFPRPVGPSHAAEVPGGEAFSVPLHLPAVETVRTYEALASWRAELLQAEANLARTGWGYRLLARRAGRERPEPGAARLAQRRWACVVEVTDGATLVRAWAYGHDPIRVTAELGALLALRLAAPTGPGPAPPPGTTAVSQVVAPRVALDHLAVRTDLRWSRNIVALPGR